MPQWSYKDSSPYKVVRCRFFDKSGRAIHPYCPESRFCRFLHPHDKGWPGLDPKPPFRSEEPPSPLSRKRARSPFESPRRSISPQRSRGRHERCYSPEMDFVQTYDQHRYSPISKYNSHRELSPVYRRERSPRVMYGNKRAYPGPNITGSNSISLRSPRSIRPRLSVDTSRPLSPEPRTPTSCNGVNTKTNNQHNLGESKNNPLKHSDDGSDTSFDRRGIQSKGLLDPMSDLSGKQKSPSEGATFGSYPAAVSRTYVPTSPKGQACTQPSPKSSKYIPASPKGPIAKDGSSNIMKLINQLTRVHLRLLDNRKTHEDESLKLQAFESLAAKFDIPIMLATAPSSSKTLVSSTGSTFGPFGSAFTTSATHSNAFGATIPIEESSKPSKATSLNSRKQPHRRSSSLPVSTAQNIGPEESHTLGISWSHPEFDRELLSEQTQRDTASLANCIGHNFGDSTALGHSNDENGHKIAHQALLETLNSIRERQAKVGTRVRDDFEEMAKVLETIWMGTFNVKTTFQGGSKEASNSETLATKGTEGASCTGSQHFAVSAFSNVAKASNSVETSLATVLDNNGKVLKKMRRVSFDDEIGASEQEKEVLRRVEEKIAGMERKLAKLVLVEKENVKMKADLKTQKEALETINRSLEDQAKMIDELVESRSRPNCPKEGSDETSQDAAVKDRP